jgi:hypothetical protein
VIPGKQTGNLEIQFTADSYISELRAVPNTGLELNVALNKAFVFPNEVSGAVLDGSGMPIVDALVVVRSLSTSLALVANTNVDGVFLISLPDDGNYSVNVSAMGFDGSESHVTLDSGSSTAVANFTLEGPGGEGEGEGEGGVGCAASSSSPGSMGDYSVLLLLGVGLWIAGVYKNRRSGLAVE